MGRRPLVIAHRGIPATCPENTLSAFRAAISARADMIELDARQARDGAVVAIHDATVDRTTDSHAAVCDMTLPELQALDAGSSFDGRFAGERIPTLDQVLDLVERAPTSLCIEIKAAGEQEGAQAAQAVAQVIQARRAEQRAVAYVEWPGVVSQIKRISPSLAVGLDAELGPGCSAWDLASQALSSGASFLAHPYHSLTDEIVELAHRHGLGVWVWTVDEPVDWNRMLDLNVDGIMTNSAGRLRTWLESR